MTETFEQFNIDPQLLNVINQLKFTHPTPIQQRVIPAVMKHQSVIGQSHTGSGKTHAFLLPLFHMLEESKTGVQYVITAPTRELATQIHDQVKLIIQLAQKESEWTSRLLVGGTDKQKMIDKLKNIPQIIVGTPGRILDLVEENVLSIYSAQAFVIDEADLMAELGLMNEVDKLLTRADPNIQLLVFSATIPNQLEHFFKKYLKHPVHVKLDDYIAPTKMEHRLIAKRHRKEADVIFDISKAIHPYLAIIFTNGKDEADQLAAQLVEYGLNVGVIHGGLAPRARKRRLKEIQQLQYQYVVATDLAARGIDIKGVSHIINAQLPKEDSFYLHRVGRTARAGLEGTAVSLYSEEDIKLIEKLEQKGLTFEFSDVIDGQWIEAKPWNLRSKRKPSERNVDREAWKRVKKTKKVKPGYKKKMKQQQERIKKNLVKKNKFK
ncbi:DEAD/DEAH box helicase [Lentibacillus saliphilus]|uniref:DEAD/DEAH box helicase n=1 Tax=Lentibacillus saliphilus TaxID=2737028 RepID=UPI001C305B81|nr:DEAD/DEAH box helicase [Lentibacillus saliphilus]